MEYLFTVDALISLVTLTVLEIVLGIDNVIFVSILIGRLHDPRQKLNARRIWMVAGIAVRIGLLLILGWLVSNGDKELFGEMSTILLEDAPGVLDDLGQAVDSENADAVRMKALIEQYQNSYYSSGRPPASSVGTDPRSR